jgi:hypothetical protein
MLMTTTINDVNGTTHFTDVVRDGHIIGNCMVFVPVAVPIAEAAPMLVYFHGYNSQTSIEHYIRSMAQRDFRPKLGSKKVVLVEPWGGTRSDFGALVTGRGLSALIDSAMFTAISNGTPSRPCPVQSPPPPSLILAGFSGGGRALNEAVVSSNAYSDRLSEAWAFDCLYSEEGQTGTWVKWAKTNDTKQLRIRVTTGESSGSPRRENAIIRKAIKGSPALSNIDAADPASMNHEDCPISFMPQWL